MILCRVEECGRPPNHPLAAAVDLIVVHGCSLAKLGPDNPDPIPDDELDAVELTARFADPALGTGARWPYHALVKRSGRAEQMLPLCLRGAHSRDYNGHSYAVAMAGESHYTASMYWSVVSLCTGLVILSGGAKIVGHADGGPSRRAPDRLPAEESSAVASKVCPPLGFDISALRADVTSRLLQYHAHWRSWSEDEKRVALEAEGWRLT